MVQLQVLQINVNHSQVAHCAAFMTAGDIKCDIVCVQDACSAFLRCLGLVLFPPAALVVSYTLTGRTAAVGQIVSNTPALNPPPFQYPDGSDIDGNVGSAAEFMETNFGIGWTMENGYKTNIFTDSLSSVEIFKKSDTKSRFINNIKRHMFQALGSLALSESSRWNPRIKPEDYMDGVDEIVRDKLVNFNIFSDKTIGKRLQYGKTLRNTVITIHLDLFLCIIKDLCIEITERDSEIYDLKNITSESDTALLKEKIWTLEREN
ncbi:hypothetical protein AVEN_272995-1 [Araneus ventricosus]|uniref:RNase H type-1 domain-containing protein n=1 Tax=Araneus ventricosus TaxID=182803 RepID=A0A4Y2F048_ARAVE|nr:hypothetical protein AVEN_272995-1 [Araneus ventricosus]